MVDEIESISDYCFGLARTYKRQRDKEIRIGEQEEKNIRKMLSLIDSAFDEMNKNLRIEGKIESIEKAYEIENKINKYRNELRKKHIECIKKNLYSYNEGVVYNDIITHSERLADHIINVSEAIYDENI